MKKISLFLYAFLLSAPTLTHAQFRNTGPTTTQEPATSPFALFGDVVTWLCGLAILIALIRLITMGIWYLTSEGNEVNNAEARKIALFHTVSLVFALAVFGTIFIFKQ